MPGRGGFWLCLRRLPNGRDSAKLFFLSILQVKAAASASPEADGAIRDRFAGEMGFVEAALVPQPRPAATFPTIGLPDFWTHPRGCSSRASRNWARVSRALPKRTLGFREDLGVITVGPGFECVL